ncbi:MAG: DegT/DnrJ/EryC1/StrS family aminotransferase [Dehalococcoidia bacterium]
MSDTLAIEGGSPVRSSPFPPYEAPAPAGDADVIEAFERALAVFCGGERVAIVCADGPSAFALAFEAAGFDGGEVVAPSLHGEAAARALLAAGLAAVPGAVDPETVNLSSRGFARAMGEGTRGMVVTHAFGHPATMEELLRLAENDGQAIVEDLSEALGGAYRGRPVGVFGAAAALTFGPGHLLTGGEGSGGAVLVDAAQEARVRATRTQHGGEPDEATVRVALAELRQAQTSLQARRAAAWQLTEQLRGMRGLAKMPHGRWVMHGYDRYVVRLRSMLWQRGAPETVDALRAEGVSCELALGPSLHLDAEVRASLGEDDARLADEHFAATSELPGELIAIPLTFQTSAEVDDVAEALRKVADANTQQAGLSGSPGAAGAR